MSLPTVCIYIFTSPSGKSYVGQTINYYKRFSQHVNDAKNGSNCPFHCAIRKYGIKSFSVQKIECEPHELNIFERLFIQIFKNIGEVYNCTDGGNNKGYKMSFESKLKMRETQLRRWRIKRQAREILEFRLYKQLREEKIKREIKFWFRVI